MRISEAFLMIVELEKNEEFRNFYHQNINLWPLVRQTLWIQLQRLNRKKVVVSKTRQLEKLIEKNCSLLTQFFVQKNKNAESLFFSLPIYLQRQSDGFHFDKVIDPLIYALNDNNKFEKYYLGLKTPFQKLKFSGQDFLPFKSRAIILENKKIKILAKIADSAGIDSKKFVDSFVSSINQFYQSYDAAKTLFRKRHKLKKVYLACWYSPYMMGIIAAARGVGINVIDVQHGKQGKLNAMYSGWNYISKEETYLMMPDFFWCWGQPSVDQILRSSKNRASHIPFVGGFTWIDYWKEERSGIIPKKPLIDENHRKKVLVTLQPIVWSETEIIPTFITDFLKKNRTDFYFIFRLHPNSKFKSKHLNKFLVGINRSSFCFDTGKTDLYTLFSNVDFHITRFSSTCFEASLFNLKTILYGNEACELYKDEISNGEFFWTKGAVNDLELFLSNNEGNKNVVLKNQYIESSIELAKTCLSM